MKINRSSFFIFIIFISSLLFFAQNLKAKDANCLDKKDCFAESSSTWNMIDTQESVEKKRKLLQANFNSLIKHKSLLYKKKLITKQQASWLKFAQDRCEFIGETSGAGGHWSYVQTNVCLIKHYDSRIELINSILTCLNLNYNDSTPDSDFNHCIENFHQIINADRNLFL